MYDVAVIGARVAGASLALQLSKQGIKVIFIDRFQEPGDTVSTHFVWPRGMTHLKRLGLAEEILKHTPSNTRLQLQFEDTILEGELSAEHVKQRFAQVGLPEENPMNRYACIRRTFLDSLIFQKAIEAGAQFEGGASLESISDLPNGGVEFTARRADGRPFQAQAKVIVGADGRFSKVARLVGAKDREVKPNGSFAFYSYFEGFDQEMALIARRGRFGIGAVATNNNATMVLAYGPKNFGKDFVSDIPKNFEYILNYVSPEFYESKFKRGRKVEDFKGTLDQRAFMRTASGRNFVLIGDAASFKDQCTASGISHALRDAELAAKYITAHLQSGASLAGYQEDRFLDSYKYYDFVATQADTNPFREEELDLFRSIENKKESIELLFGVFSDSLPPKAFFRQSHVERAVGTSTAPSDETARIERQHINPFKDEATRSASAEKLEVIPLTALTRTCAEYSNITGPRFEDRVARYGAWAKGRQVTGTWQYSRTLEEFPGPTSRLTDSENREIKGINFASQDYLGLGECASVREEAQRALFDFGPHSAGSPMVIGNTSLSRELEKELAAFLKMEEVMLFPTGWAAGYGVIAGLVRPHDHIVMDKLSHSCLQQGAFAATKKIHRHPHLDVVAARAQLKKIRSYDKRNGVVVISEGIFSMDSDAPDLAALQEACREYDALLIVDVAHDLGALGPNGTGMLGLQGILGKVDVVMGSFSKSFSSNGGFVATHSAALKEYLKMYSSPHLFSNALSPVQTAVVRECLRIIQSADGQKRRDDLMRAVISLRNGIESRGLELLGVPSAIVPVIIGNEDVARVAHRQMMLKNIAAMILEFPVVATGQSRFRLQVMATHTEAQARIAANAVAESIAEAKEILAPTKSPTKVSRPPIIHRPNFASAELRSFSQ